MNKIYFNVIGEDFDLWVNPCNAAHCAEVDDEMHLISVDGEKVSRLSIDFEHPLLVPHKWHKLQKKLKELESCY